MQHGDFTELAKFYYHRPGYSLEVLDMISGYIQSKMGVKSLKVADVGAGTGKLTENLVQSGFTGYAVEPNDAMRTEGMKFVSDGEAFTWYKGNAEKTGLPDNCVDWVLMGSSFHWTDSKAALKEFHRILRPGGFFTAIYNPRDIKSHALHMEIEEEIQKMVPNLNRVSSGASQQNLPVQLLETPYFSDLIFVEASHVENMTKERYMGAWYSVNDIRVQAGEERFRQILEMIERKIDHLDIITVPYKIRSWTVRATKQ